MEKVEKGNLFYQSIGEPSIEQRPLVIKNPLIRFFAQFFSYLFHPLFITSYVIFFLIFVHPLAFAGFDFRDRAFRFIAIFFTTVFLPLFSVLIAWQLRLGIDSIHLRTQKERIIPYVMVMIFYWWAWHVYDNLPDIPPVAIHFLFGAFLSICVAWFCNIYFKISMHAVAMGGLIMFFCLFSFSDNFTSGIYLSLAIFIAGLVCTSRLILSEHNGFEIYSGLFVGILTQWAAWQF